jgi:disulfide bond formation protein DsbB
MRLTALLSVILSRWPLVALGVSLAMLGAALGFERFGNMVPCILCIHQREAYVAAAVIAVFALIANRMSSDRLSGQAFGILLACAFGAGAVVAGFHMGVEFKWWEGLKTCSGGGKLVVTTDILGTLSKSMEAPSCDKVAWSMLGLSMAGWNMLISSGLALMSVLSVVALQEKKAPAHV